MRQPKRELAMFLHPYEYEMLECQINHDRTNGDGARQPPAHGKRAGREEETSLITAGWRRVFNAMGGTQGGRIAQVARRKSDTSD
jgi:hypothetical protein